MAVLLFPHPHSSRLSLHTTKPFGRYKKREALRLYKFYIIFMRHKVVEKPTEEGRRGLESEQCGEGEESTSKMPLSPSLSPPPVATVLTWLGGADRTPSCSLVAWDTKRGGGDSRQGRRGWCAVLGVDCSSPDELYIEERFASCLVKNFPLANTSISFIRQNAVSAQHFAFLVRSSFTSDIFCYHAQ